MVSNRRGLVPLGRFFHTLLIVTSYDRYSDHRRYKPIYTVFQKSDANIEITITTTNLIRIKYPLSSFIYRLSCANIANFTKILCTVFEQQLFKKWNSKQKFPIWKSRLSSSYTIPSVKVCAQSGCHLHRHLHVSCADRTFSAAAGLPVCMQTPYRQSAAEVGQMPNKTTPCQEIPPTTFWHCIPLLCLKTLISILSSLVKTIAFYVNQTRHKNVTNITSLFVTLPALSMLIGIFHIGKFCFKFHF